MSIDNPNSRRVLKLPTYTRGEERMNMVTHIVGASLGILALVACILVAAITGTAWGVVTSAIYGFSVILLFTMSSIYHGLHVGKPKKVFQTLDHCTIFVLIAGTYTPILLNDFRIAHPVQAWTLFGVIWGVAALGIVMKAIDVNRFKIFSVVLYLAMGWAAMIRLNPMMEVLGSGFFILLLIGGALYTLGVVFYAVGAKKKYMHGIFHLFVVAASIMHTVAIAVFVI